ncbi:MAG: phosphoribosylformylglycinamidine synthase subunit PurQ [Deltaproteobacteria bacterium]|nr:phosphoribosylformylglycinamidine synthase subunit PurQ [Deltaproteobacteria bacterium]
MKPVRVLVPVGFGFNCEEETSAAFRMVGAEVDQVHLTDLFAGRAPLPIPGYQVLAFVGGFSYGDHVASGFVAATRVRAHLQAELSSFLANGGRVLGICNGFQVLVRLGLLPGPEAGPHDFVPRAALANNDRLGYRDAWVRLGADERSACAWTRGLSTLEVPARHGEGKFVVESDAALARLEERRQVAFRYLDPAGQPTEAWPHNPNGSARGVAGVTDATGRILGLMPHPDAFLYPWHHPDYARRKKEIEAQEPGGLAIFRAGVTGI